ncbi:DsbC family protein [Neiella sp. HB171785]|uniref:Thiol:disulfide interchange protein n=1 Tax=Neiella litorisoli TaxID=2771431 RepID=A0A8J6UIX5_9GAMM|nr:DsbC family protein [Neiella litorisoli]MBD1389388.1 DsbC family protein [Neiella litorisoli]
MSEAQEKHEVEKQRGWIAGSIAGACLFGLVLGAFVGAGFGAKKAAEPKPSVPVAPQHPTLSLEELSASFYGKTELKPDDVRSSDVDGWVEVSVGPALYWMSEQGRYIMRGALIDTIDGNVNLTYEREKGLRAEVLAKARSTALTYKAGNERAEIYVFTDTTCGYCRRFHENIQTYLDEGITVHYLAFPRGGVSQESAMTMLTAWCAQDQQAAFDSAVMTNSVNVPGRQTCDPAIIGQHYTLGEKLGVRGTPAIYLANSDSIPGAQPVTTVLRHIGIPSVNLAQR